MARPRVLSGIQPTADSFHLGNYLVRVRQWVEMQETHDAYYCVVDLHALTVECDPELLRRRTRVAAAQLFAIGLDPEQCTVFVQSHVREHTELAWILTCLTGMGEAVADDPVQGQVRQAGRVRRRRACSPTRSCRPRTSCSTRPTRCRSGPTRSSTWSSPATSPSGSTTGSGRPSGCPQPYILKEVEKITDLQEPTAKMSKSSSSPQGILDLLEEPGPLRKKIMRAVTDTGTEILADEENKPGITNLLRILSALTGTPIPELEERYEGQGYGTFKKDVAEAVIETFTPIRERTQRLLADEAELDKLLAIGAERARAVAQETMEKVRERVGFLPIPR